MIWSAAAAGTRLLGKATNSTAQPTTHALRKDVRSAAGARDLGSYAVAVKLLQSLDPSDPLHWYKNSQTHSDWCPHFNWWFLPWHRAYLFYFEKICRQVTGDTEFCLPYWDWTADSRIPAEFWGQGNDLFDDTRGISPDDPIDNEEGEYNGRGVIEKILTSTWVDCYSAATTADDQRDGSPGAGMLESAHNHVHSAILGDMVNVQLSPRDPIFWLHHANVDRIWASWMQANELKTPDTPLWAEHKLRQFYDVDTQAIIEVVAKDTLEGARFGAIYDRYETSNKVSTNPVVSSAVVSWKSGSTSILRSETRGPSAIAIDDVGLVHMNVSHALNVMFNSVAQRLEHFVLAGHPDGTLAAVKSPGNFEPTPGIHLLLEGVRRPSEQIVSVRVFLNNKHASISTPISDPAYVGTVSFFGDDHRHGSQGGATFILPVWETLISLGKTGAYKPGSPVEVALVVVGRKGALALNPGQVVKADKIAFIGPRS
jgi:tyrosinase